MPLKPWKAMVTVKFHCFEMMGSVWAKMLQWALSLFLSLWIIQKIFPNSNQSKRESKRNGYWVPTASSFPIRNVSNPVYRGEGKTWFMFFLTIGVLGSCFSSLHLKAFYCSPFKKTNRALNCCLVWIQTAVYSELLFL